MTTEHAPPGDLDAHSDESVVMRDRLDELHREIGLWHSRCMRVVEERVLREFEVPLVEEDPEAHVQWHRSIDNVQALYLRCARICQDEGVDAVAAFVSRARAAGAAWGRVGGVLGLPRTTAISRYRSLDPAPALVLPISTGRAS